jgi:hypothetical protein
LPKPDGQTKEEIMKGRTQGVLLATLARWSRIEHMLGRWRVRKDI